MGMDGSFTVDVQEIKVIESQKGTGQIFIVETQVIESSHPQIRINEIRSWMCMLNSKSGQSDTQAFCLEVLSMKMGRPVTKADLANPAVIMAICDATQPMRGVRLALRTWTRPQKKDPTKSWTTHDWRAMDPGTVQGIEIDHNVPHVQAYAPVAAAPAPYQPVAPVQPVYQPVAPAAAPVYQQPVAPVQPLNPPPAAPPGVAPPPGAAPGIAGLFQ